MPDLQLRARIAAALAAERTRNGWSQGELADQLGWSQTMVSKAERRKRVIAADELPQLCRALNITLADLYRGAPEADLVALGIRAARET